MGQHGREKPERLAEKLLQIRTSLGLSQNGLISRLGLTDKLTQSQVAAFERGAREPSLLVLLAYAKVARVSTDVLIDDEVYLPKRLTGG
jgi:transcriptional regulator with XRE-family HTH domain